MKRTALLVSLLLLTSLFADDIKTTDGNTYKDAQVVEQDASTVTIKHSSGFSKINRSALPDDIQKKYGNDPNDPAKLRARITDLEKQISVLQEENQKLRRQLVTPSAQPASTTQPSVSQPSKSADQSGGYWISSTGKRHNSGCRYYKNCKGHEGGATDGIACKICGG